MCFQQFSQVATYTCIKLRSSIANSPRYAKITDLSY